TRSIGWNYESAYGFIACVVAGLGPDDCDLRSGSVRDPHFRPVDNPTSIFPDARARDHRRRVRPIVWLGETKASDYFSLCHFWQVLTLLLLTAEGVDRIHHQSALHRRERAHNRVAALKLVRDQYVREVV